MKKLLSIAAVLSVLAGAAVLVYKLWIEDDKSYVGDFDLE